MTESRTPSFDFIDDTMWTSDYWRSEYPGPHSMMLTDEWFIRYDEQGEERLQHRLSADMPDDRL